MAPFAAIFHEGMLTSRARINEGVTAGPFTVSLPGKAFGKQDRTAMDPKSDRV